MSPTYLTNYLAFAQPLMNDKSFIFMLGGIIEQYEMIGRAIMSEEDKDNINTCYAIVERYLLSIDCKEPKFFMMHCNNEVEHFFVSRAEANM